jgi:hypothetical protein
MSCPRCRSTTGREEEDGLFQDLGTATLGLLVVEGGVLAVLPEEEAEASLAASTGSTGAA